jgi:hypothetical protein
MSEAILDKPIASPAFKYPDVQPGDLVLFSTGPDDVEWCPFLVTGINCSTERTPILNADGSQKAIDGKLQWGTRETVRSIRGCAFTHTEACVQVGYKNVYYIGDPALESPELRHCITLSHSQGIWKPTARLAECWRVKEALAKLKK